MKIDGNAALQGAKQIIGLAALIMIGVGVAKAFGIQITFLKVGGTELAALAAAAAFISRS